MCSGILVTSVRPIHRPADFSVFYMNRHRTMPAAVLANPALFTDRLRRQLCVAGDAAVHM